MKISEHLQKDYWVRRVYSDRSGFVSLKPSLANYKTPIVGDANHPYLQLTQEDLMDEITPTAHKIFSAYQSRRAVYRPSGEKNKQGKEKWVIDHYDDVEQVPLAMQWRMAMTKTSHFAADGFWTADESGMPKHFQRFKSWLDYSGIQNAWIELVWSCLSTGDGAIYLYQRGKEIEYKVFSRWNGYTLYPDIDEDGNDVLWVEYTLKGRRAVDYYAVDRIETWVQLDDNDDSKKWWDSVKGWFKKDADTREKSEDGYTLVSRRPTQVGNDICQCVYFRVNDIPSGVVEPLIQALERTCSFVAEEVKSSAFPALFIKSASIKSLPSVGTNGKTIGVRGSIEELKASDAKYLDTPDASNIATLHIATLRDEIYHASQSVIIDPDILKSGADSSSTMKILFAPEIQWCQVMWTQFYQPLRRMVEVFKRLVGKVEGNPLEYADLRISVGQRTWIPQNRAEEVDTTCKMVYARLISRQSGISELGLSYIGDYAKIQDEWEEELEMKARIPAEVKAKFGESGSIDDESNPYKTGVDNNDKGKSIQK